MTRVFKPLIGGDWIVGVVGPLQLDVLAARIKTEYELGVRLRAGALRDRALGRGRGHGRARSASSTPIVGALAEDHDGAPVFLARNAWELETDDQGMAQAPLHRHARAQLRSLRSILTS